ncbi:hypothetical protein GGR53DRAFT_409781 [Hypoxylon sp. FL1150]|nr:hypothetical protein GGR53DRAFT_409781 [Hypoxylon sp. FL1150]
MAHFGESELSSFLDGIKKILDQGEHQQHKTLEAHLKGVQAKHPTTVATAGLSYWIGRLEFFQFMTDEEQLGYCNQFMDRYRNSMSGWSAAKYDCEKAMYLLPRVVEYAGTVRPGFYVEGRSDKNFFVWWEDAYLCPTRLNETLASEEENVKERSEIPWVNAGKREKPTAAAGILTQRSSRSSELLKELLLEYICRLLTQYNTHFSERGLADRG